MKLYENEVSTCTRPKPNKKLGLSIVVVPTVFTKYSPASE